MDVTLSAQCHLSVCTSAACLRLCCCAQTSIDAGAMYTYTASTRLLPFKDSTPCMSTLRMLTRPAHVAWYFGTASSGAHRLVLAVHALPCVTDRWDLDPAWEVAYGVLCT